ncbi:MAG TPA: protease modulator HflK [Chthoniobacterales bacterium]|jgi:HflK protein
MKSRRSQTDGLIMEALLHTLRNLTRGAQWLCLLLLTLYAFSGIRFVGPRESALVLRLGSLQPKVHGPGLLLVWPSPVDEVIRVQTGVEHALVLDGWEPRGARVVRDEKAVQMTGAEMTAELESKRTGNGLLKNEPEVFGDYLDPVLDGYTVTGDWNILQGRFTLRYRIADPVAWFRVGSQGEALLRHLVYRSVTHALSASRIDHALTDEREKLARQIREHLVTEAARLQLGVVPTALEMRDIAPPRQVVAAFEDVISAKLFSKTLVENAEEYRLKQTAEIEGQANAVKQRSEAFASKLIASAHGESEAFRLFLAQYQKNPELVGSRLYTETVGHIMRQVNSATLLPPGSQPPQILVEPSPDLPR